MPKLYSFLLCFFRFSHATFAIFEEKIEGQNSRRKNGGRFLFFFFHSLVLFRVLFFLVQQRQKILKLLLLLFTLNFKNIQNWGLIFSTNSFTWGILWFSYLKMGLHFVTIFFLWSRDFCPLCLCYWFLCCFCTQMIFFSRYLHKGALLLKIQNILESFEQINHFVVMYNNNNKELTTHKKLEIIWWTHWFTLVFFV